MLLEFNQAIWIAFWIWITKSCRPSNINYRQSICGSFLQFKSARALSLYTDRLFHATNLQTIFIECKKKLALNEILLYIVGMANKKKIGIPEKPVPRTLHLPPTLWEKIKWVARARRSMSGTSLVIEILREKMLEEKDTPFDERR